MSLSDSLNNLNDSLDDLNHGQSDIFYLEKEFESE